MHSIKKERRVTSGKYEETPHSDFKKCRFVLWAAWGFRDEDVEGFWSCLGGCLLITTRAKIEIQIISSRLQYSCKVLLLFLKLRGMTSDHQIMEAYSFLILEGKIKREGKKSPSRGGSSVSAAAFWPRILMLCHPLSTWKWAHKFYTAGFSILFMTRNNSTFSCCQSQRPHLASTRCSVLNQH